MGLGDMSSLSLFRGKGLDLYNGISIKHPTVGEIEEIGEDKYSKYYSCLSATSVDIADILCFELNIWYEDIKDEWEFFIQKCLMDKSIITVTNTDKRGKVTIETGCYAIGKSYRDSLNYFLGLDGEYVVIERILGDTTQLVLYNAKPDETGENFFIDDKSFKFSKLNYERTVKFLNDINWSNRDYEFLKGGNKAAKKFILKKTLARQRNKPKKAVITLESILSSLVAKGISYEQVWNLPIYAAYDLYYRLVKIEEYNNTMSALYSGCLDTKKNPINWEKINWSTIIKN
jgi:hypothetical protein